MKESISGKRVMSIFLAVAVIMTMFVAVKPMETEGDHLDEGGYALLAAPGFIGPDIELEIQALRSYLLSHGWTDDNIIFLIDDKNWGYVDGDATRANIQNGIAYIAQHSTSSDTVFIGVLDRATDGIECTYFETSIGIFTDDDLGGWIDEITCNQMVIEISSIYSGGFIEECKGDDRLIVCSHEEGQSTEPNLYRLSRGLTTMDADTDNDGRVSVEEAHAYEEENMVGEQTPVSWDHANQEIFM